MPFPYKFKSLTASLFLLGLILYYGSGLSLAAIIELDPDEYEHLMGRYWDHGFIASKAELEKIKKGEVIAGLSGNSIIGPGEIFVGAFQADQRPPVGDRYMAVRIGAEVYMAGGREKIGTTISPLALIEIIETSGTQFRGKIIKLRLPVIKGVHVIGFKPRQGSQKAQIARPDTLQATIIASRDDKSIFGPNDLVYLDKGKSTGLSSGQLLEIFSKYKGKEPLTAKSFASTLWYGRPESKGGFERPDLTEPLLIGKAMVTSLRETTSAAIITEVKREVLLGDAVRIKEGE